MSIRCIALDLDRTTLNSAGQLSERNRKAMEQAIESGIQIAVASGRSLDSLPAAVLEIPGIRYAITSNGAAVYDLEERTCLRQYKLTAEAVRDILRWTEEADVTFEAFIDGKPYAEKDYVEDPVRFGAMPQSIPYIQGTREPVENMRHFIQRHEEELDCIDVVVKSEEYKRQLWKTLEKTGASCVYHFICKTAAGDFGCKCGEGRSGAVPDRISGDDEGGACRLWRRAQ